MIGILLNVVHFQVHKNITKESDGFHNHFTQLTMLSYNYNPNICDVKLYYNCFIYLVPSEIKARGPGAQIAYENALKTGKVKVYRARIMLIGQDRAGKTSLKKSFLGLPFDPQEESTDGIEVDPSKFEVDTDLVKNWKRTDEKLEVSQFAADLARMVARELQENADDEEEGDEEINGEDNEIENEGNVNLVQVNQRGVTSEYLALGLNLLLPRFLAP